MFVLPQSINYSSELSTNLKNFLRCLADHCGDKPVCWPSQARIAAYMNVSVRTVQRCERLAVELQLVRVERRWLKSNRYHVLCLEKRLSTMATPERRIEQTTQEKNNVCNGSSRTTWKSPAEIKLLLEDMSEVFGAEVSERNKGWFYRIARTVEDSWIYEGLSWLRQALLEAEYSGAEIQSPSGLFTWWLRQAGAPI